MVQLGTCVVGYLPIHATGIGLPPELMQSLWQPAHDLPAPLAIIRNHIGKHRGLMFSRPFLSGVQENLKSVHGARSILRCTSCDLLQPLYGPTHHGPSDSPSPLVPPVQDTPGPQVSGPNNCCWTRASHAHVRGNNKWESGPQIRVEMAG